MMKPTLFRFFGSVLRCAGVAPVTEAQVPNGTKHCFYRYLFRSSQGAFSFLKFTVTASLLLIITASAGAQGFPETQQSTGAPTATIIVYLRTQQGEPIPFSSGSRVTLYSGIYGVPVATVGVTTGDGWMFSGIRAGDEYDVEVKADGYETAHETVLVPPEGGFSTSVVVFLKPSSGNSLFHPPNGQFILAPRAQKEIEKGLRDLQANKKDAARKHFSNALQMAPGNPYTNYLMGMSFLLDNKVPAAATYLEKSVSIDPKEAPALHALGTVRFRQHDYAGAIQALVPAVQLDPSSWKSEWLLTGAYLQVHDFERAREFAEKALLTGKEQAGQVELLLGEAFHGLGEREKAVGALEKFVKQFPNDPNAPIARRWIEHLRRPRTPQDLPSAVPVAEHTTAPADPPAAVVAAPPLGLPPRENWEPADIDTEKPFVVSNVACSLPKVLQQSGKSAQQLVDDLQQFSATEEYESVEIKHNGNLETPETRQFSYLVFINQPSPGRIQVDEFRDQGLTAKQMPGRLADMGAPALVLAFHPLFQDDFHWSCDGLGEWKGKAAWIVRLQQRDDRPNRLANFQSLRGTYPVPIKGLAWVSETGQVMHMETDLVSPIVPVKLQRQHFVIDYQPVSFRTHKVTLWLPENVNVYFQFQNHYLHHSHRFSNFKLFWTGATQKIGKPKEASLPQ